MTTILNMNKYELAHLALFGAAAIVLLVFAWTFGAFVR